MVNHPTLGVLVMAYGTPRNLNEVEPYYTHIRRGRKPTPELLAELKGRYEAIGGVSPLNEITEAQGRGLEDALNADGGRPCKVYLGMKHAEPFIKDAVRQMAEDGIQEAVSIVLAPHYSTMSVAVYQREAKEAADTYGIQTLLQVNNWHLQSRFIRVLESRVAKALEKLQKPEDAMVIFSAHSLPERILQVNDPYPAQLHETGDAISEHLGIAHHCCAWQSAGRTSETWLGPDILDVLKQLQSQGYREVVVCSAGFVSDHLEVLYDVDIECQNLARELGLHLVRTESLNADPEFLKALAEVVRDREQQGYREGTDSAQENRGAN